MACVYNKREGVVHAPDKLPVTPTHAEKSCACKVKWP
jgi:hypothetical protein